MQKHHDEIRANVPEFGGVMFTCFKKIVNFKAFIAAFRGSSGIINGFPFVAVTGRRVVKADIGLQRDTASSAVFGGRTGSLAGTSSTRRQRAAKFSVLTLEIIAVRFHFQASITKGNAVRANGNAVVVICLFGVAEVEVNEGLNMIALTKLVHSHRIMGRVQEQLAGFQGRSISAEAKERFAKAV